jgi:hypothetical protein
MSQRPALPKEWGARETRQKTRKGMRGVAREAHVTSRDPTLNAGRTPARSGVACPKNAQRQYLTCPSELVLPPSWSRLKSGGLKILANLRDL